MSSTNNDGSRSTEAANLLTSTLIEAMPQPVIMTDGQGSARQFNERWLSLSGLRRSASGGRRWLGAQAPENPAASARAWIQAGQDGRPFDATYAMHTPSGRVAVDWHHEPIHGGGAGQGVVTGWLCTGVPVLTDAPFGLTLPGTAAASGAASQEATLEHLALELHWLGGVLAQLPLGVLVEDAQTRRVRMVNPQAQHLLGLPLAPGMTLARLEELRLSGSDARLTGNRLPLHRALGGLPVDAEELDLTRPDGSRVLLRVSAAPILDDLGQVSAAVMTLEDITARSDLQGVEGEQAQRERLSTQMQRAQEVKFLRDGEPITPERFATLMGELYEQLGLPSLEGRLIALLLLSAKPVSLGEAAHTLGVSKVAVAKVSTVMQQRGDLMVSKFFSSREHLLALTDHTYIHDLSVRRITSWAISLLCDALLTTNHLEAVSARQLRSYLETHTQVAVALERILSPIEHRQAQALATHLRENWDAVTAPHEKSDPDPDHQD
ncbi:hypothetical protein GCM10022631_09740 [Deinococcus rubellus]|uniref:PAS domain-containing protein n=1 Tax=Deinococcus rubellus TaxID=1889240 RepID=UPI0031E7B3EA